VIGQRISGQHQGQGILLSAKEGRRHDRTRDQRNVKNNPEYFINPNNSNQQAVVLYEAALIWDRTDTREPRLAGIDLVKARIYWKRAAEMTLPAA
jgi:hypothetical protein